MKYLDANTYFKERFGRKLYKASISLDVTCPNRDGKCGTGGCAFCSEGGSGEFAIDKGNVTEQINLAIEKLSKKVKGDAGYIAYFQSFTNTYCEAEYLKSKVSEAMKHEKVYAVSIATRPDCLPEEILGVLAELNTIKPIFVELGLQTSNDTTAKWFGRGYESEVYLEAVKNLRDRGINVITHVIFGLKNETEEDMLNSVKYAVDAGTDGIKITLLYILKGTRVEEEWRRGEIILPEMEEYFNLIEKAITVIPKNVVVHRITGDGPKSLLLAPMWTANKRAVINYINRRFG